MTLKVCQDPLNPRPGGAGPPRTPNLAPMCLGYEEIIEPTQISKYSTLRNGKSIFKDQLDEECVFPHLSL